MNTYRPLNRFAIFCVLMLVVLSAVGQTNVTIRGRVADGAGKHVRLGGYSDMLTQKEVADRLGISQSYISRLEKRILARLNTELTRLSS